MLSFLAVAVVAAANPLPDLEGQWEGFLEYRDYQSGDMERIPLSIDGKMHGTVLVQRLTFIDPGWKVERVSTAVWDAKNSALHRSYSDDSGVEAQSAPVSIRMMPNGWVVTIESDGMDDGAPALIREVISLDGDLRTSEKWVDPKGDDIDTFEFRNRTETRKTAQ